MDQLTELLVKYAEAQPNAVRGGLTALSGFDYQVRLYVADFVTSLALDNRLVDSSEPFINAFEALADYTRSSDSQLVCVQAKTRLDSLTASKAAVEFCRIDDFLERSAVPNLRANTRYELVARETDQVLPWQNVKLPKDILSRYPNFQDRWHHIVENEKLLQPRIEADPWWRLISSIFNLVDDPFGFARRSLDRCMRFGRDSQAAVAVRDAIAEDFSTARRRPNTFADLVSRDEATSVADASDKIIIAATPTMEHLRRNYFMPRPERVTEASNIINSVVELRLQADATYLDVIWIQGRSGAGKSVLLLQLLQYLRLQNDNSIVWLGNSVHRLPKLLLELQCTEPRYPAPDFIFIDDLYDPQSRNNLELSQLTSMFVHMVGARWPIIVTCGPTEFRQALERDTRAEAIRIHTYSLNPMPPEETRTVVHWYEERAGVTVPSGPAVKQSHALMISVLLEMKHGDLRPFAHRIAARLNSQNLLDALRIPLAMNRLYIWTPADWLSFEEQTRLDTLNQDGDFAIIGRELRAGYIRLSHPHLSDSIYLTIYQHQSARTIAHDLANAFDRSLRTDFSTALRVLQAVASNNARLASADHRVLATEMVAALEMHQGLVESQPNFDAAFFWSAWIRWATRDDTIARLTQAFDPLTRAIRALGMDHTYWPRLWSDLWHCVAGHPELKRIAKIWLGANAAASLWRLPWQSLLSHEAITAAENGDITQVEQLLSSGWGRVNAHPHSPDVSWICESLLENYEFLPEQLPSAMVTRFIVEWLGRNEEGLDWNFVWRALLRNFLLQEDLIEATNVFDVGHGWLDSHAENPGWPFVFEELLLQHRHVNSSQTIEQIIDRGEQWLSQYPNDPATPYVKISILWASSKEDQLSDEASEPILKWLAVNPDNSRWHSVWFELATKRKRKISATTSQRLYEIGLEWLDGRNFHDRFAFVWQETFGHALETGNIDRADGLASTGVALLLDLSTPNWTHVFFHLQRWVMQQRLNFAEVETSIIEAANRWLLTPGRTERLDWTEVYRRLFKFEYDDLHVEMGIRFLYERSTRFPGQFAGFLLTQAISPSAVKRIAQWFNNWFPTATEETAGISIWLRLRSRQESEPPRVQMENGSILRKSCGPTGRPSLAPGSICSRNTV